MATEQGMLKLAMTAPEVLRALDKAYRAAAESSEIGADMAAALADLGPNVALAGGRKPAAMREELARRAAEYRARAEACKYQAWAGELAAAQAEAARAAAIAAAVAQRANGSGSDDDRPTPGGGAARPVALPKRTTATAKAA